MKFRNMAPKAAIVSALAFLSTLPAHAELPTAVTTAVTGYQTDATAAIALIMAAGVTIWGLLKLASKLGWR